MNDDGKTPLNLAESVDIALRAYKGKVLMTFPKPVPHIIFEPQNAFTVAEHLARAAHEARFPGQKVPEDFSYLANQVKARLTDELRDRLVLRIRAMIPSLLESKDLNYISKQIVDTVFSAVDDVGNNRL